MLSNAKKVWSNYTYVHMYPVSRGTWSVHAAVGNPRQTSKTWTKLGFEEALEVYTDAWFWAIEQQKFYKKGVKVNDTR